MNNVEPFPALIGGLSLELMPKLIAHFGAGHISLIFAFSWTPWFLVVEKKNFDKHSFYRDILQMLLFAMVILADLRWAPFVFLLWISYRLYYHPLKQGGFGKFVIDTIKPVFFSVLLTAPVLLPFLQFVGLSSRNQLTTKDNLFLSLHPVNLFSFFIPNIGGKHGVGCLFGVDFFVFITILYMGGQKENRLVVLDGSFPVRNHIFTG